MNPDDIVNLPDYIDEINRSKLRFCGIGPRMLGQPNRIWPRDSINPEKEANIVIYRDLAKLIEPHHKIRVQRVLIELFSSLQRCNITNLFKSHIVARHKHKQFITIAETIDGYTEYLDVLGFVHAILRSIKLPSISTRADPMIKLLGCSRNVTIYNQHLKWLVSGNLRMSKMLIGKFVCFKHLKMDLTKVSWLDDLSDVAKTKLFIQVISRTTWFLAQTLRRYFYITISNPYVNKIFYYRYDLWMRLQSFIIKIHIEDNLFQEIRLAASDGIPAGHTSSRMRFHLKRDNVRLICTEPRQTGDAQYQLRAAIEYVIKNMQNNNRFKSPYDLFECLTDMKRMSHSENKKVYVVRIDFENCFQSIYQEKLKSIIMDFLRAHFPSGRLTFQKLSLGLKNPRRRHIYKWTLNANLNELNQKKKYNHVEVMKSVEMPLPVFGHKFLTPLIIEPILRESSKSKLGYILKSGIRQGSRASPILCGIYIREAFNRNLSELLTSEDCRFIMHVDDILLMTTDADKAERFLNMTVSGIDGFNLRSNPDKLKVNFPSQSSQRAQPLKESITFYKRKIYLETLGCSKEHSTSDIGIDNFMSAEPYADEMELRKITLHRYYTRIEALLLDFDLNGMQLVIRNIFESALNAAYRAAAQILISFVLRDVQNQRPALLTKLVVTVSKLFYSSIESARSIEHVVNSLNYNECHLIVLAAFTVTWQTKRMRHRKLEQERLRQSFSRHMMRYLVFHYDQADSFEMRGSPFETILRDLMKSFPRSTFYKNVLLPTR